MTTPKPRALEFVAKHDLTIERMDSIWTAICGHPLALNRADANALMSAGMTRDDANATRAAWLKALSIQDLYDALGDNRRCWER